MVRDISVLVQSQSWDRNEDFSETMFSNKGGLLVVKQKSPDGQTVNATANSYVLRLELAAMSQDMNVTELALTKTGDAPVGRIMCQGIDYVVSGDKVALEFSPPLVVRNRETKMLDIYADISNAQTGSAVGFRVKTLSDIKVTEGTVTVVSELEDYTRYINNVPQEIKVDGAFGDWQGKSLPDAVGDANNSNIDIVRYGVFTDTVQGTVSFHLKVYGEMLGGTAVPWKTPSFPWKPPLQAQPSPPSPPSPPRKIPVATGVDTAYFFIDSDNDTSTGYSVGGVGADYSINITGKYGNIIDSRLEKYLGDGWVWNWTYAESVDVMKESRQLECGLSKSAIGILDNSTWNVYFQVSDWRRAKDWERQNSLFDPYVLASGGELSWSADGATWTPVGDAGADTDFTDITSDGSKYLYALTRSGRVHRSMDGGTSWALWGTGPSATTDYDSIVARTDVTGIVYVLRTTGVHYSYDGTTWTANLGTVAVDTYVGIALGRTSGADLTRRLYIVDNDGQWYWNGLSLTRILTATPDGDVNPAPTNDYTDMGGDADGYLYVLDNDGPIRKSTDGGTTWVSMTDPCPINNVCVRIEGDPLVSGLVWILRSDGPVYRSTDGGTSWIQPGDAGGLTYVGLTCPIPEFPTVFWPVALAPVLVIAYTRVNGRRHGRPSPGPRS